MSCRFGSEEILLEIFPQTLTFENLAQHTQKDSPGLAGSDRFSKRPVMSFFGFSEQAFWGGSSVPGNRPHSTPNRIGIQTWQVSEELCGAVSKMSE